MKNNYKNIIKTLVTITMASCAAVQASIVIEEPFDEPLGGLPANWTFASQAANNANAGRAEIAELSVDRNALRFRRTTASTQSAALFYTGPEVGTGGGRILNYTAEVTFQYTQGGGSSVAGFAVRADSLSYSYEGYFIGINPGAGSVTDYGPGIGIWKDPTTAGATISSALEFTPFASSLSSGADYVVSLTVEDNTIEASLWLQGNPDNILGTVLIENADADAGYFGLRSRFGANDSDYWFSDLELNVSAIPEASTYAMIMGVIGLAMVVAHRRRRKDS